jgi:hypothetical protein
MTPAPTEDIILQCSRISEGVTYRFMACKRMIPHQDIVDAQLVIYWWKHGEPEKAKCVATDAFMKTLPQIVEMAEGQRARWLGSFETSKEDSHE